MNKTETLKSEQITLYLYPNLEFDLSIILYQCKTKSKVIMYGDFDFEFEVWNSNGWLGTI